MKNTIKLVVLAFFAMIVASSCTSINHSMMHPQVHVELKKEDFKLSAQVSAEASTFKVLGIDFSRILKKEAGTIEGLPSRSLIPIIGPILEDKTASYALYELMKKNPGYDVILYPQYETKVFKPVLGIGFISKKTTVVVKARLGKLTD